MEHFHNQESSTQSTFCTPEGAWDVTTVDVATQLEMQWTILPATGGSHQVCPPHCYGLAQTPTAQYTHQNNLGKGACGILAADEFYIGWGNESGRHEKIGAFPSWPKKERPGQETIANDSIRRWIDSVYSTAGNWTLETSLRQFGGRLGDTPSRTATTGVAVSFFRDSI